MKSIKLFIFLNFFVLNLFPVKYGIITKKCIHQELIGKVVKIERIENPLPYTMATVQNSGEAFVVHSGNDSWIREFDEKEAQEYLSEKKESKENSKKRYAKINNKHRIESCHGKIFEIEEEIDDLFILNNAPTWCVHKTEAEEVNAEEFNKQKEAQ